MDIAFKTAKLAKTFNCAKQLSKAYGDENARLIMRRMMVLANAPTLADVPHHPPERRHELVGSRKGQFAVDVKHPRRIVFEPAHDPVPRKDDGGIDLPQITSIRILSVEDYH